MKEIVSQYGKTVVAIVSVILVIGIIFGTATRKKPLMSQASENGSLNYTVEGLDSGRTTFKETGKRLNIKTSNGVVAGREYSVEELFTGDGIKDIRLIQISGTGGEDITKMLYKNKKVIFQKDGIYKLKIWAECSDGSFGTEFLYMGVENL